MRSRRVLHRGRVELGDFLGHAYDVFQRSACVVGQVNPIFNLSGPFAHGPDRLLGVLLDRLDHGRDFFGGLRGPFGELPHFVGDYRESAPLLTRPSRFNGCIQSQEIRLIGDVIDDTDDLADLVAGFAELCHCRCRSCHDVRDFSHSRDRVVHHTPAVFGSLPAFLRCVGSGRGVLGVLHDGFRHLPGCTRDLLRLGRLLTGRLNWSPGAPATRSSTTIAARARFRLPWSGSPGPSLCRRSTGSSRVSSPSSRRPISGSQR